MSTYSGVEGSPPSFGELLRNKDLYRLDETVYDEGCDISTEVPFALLPGETPRNIGLYCTEHLLILTNYRLFASVEGGYYSRPLGLVELATLYQPHDIVLTCRDTCTIRLTLDSSAQCKLWLERIQSAIKPPVNFRDTFAFVHYAYVTDTPLHSLYHNGDEHEKSRRITAEYKRLGMNHNGQWRIAENNTQYKMCPTYPKLIVVPQSISDADLEEVAKFRSGGRVPAVVWRHRHNGSVIVRSSQPLVGMLGWRCQEDERLVAAISESCTMTFTDVSSAPIMETMHREVGEIEATANGACPGVHAEPSVLLVMDLRTYTATLGNRAKGGGCECSDYYPNCEVVYKGMPNIHSVRKSFQLLRTLLSNREHANFLSSLEHTQWLQYISHLLSVATGAVSAIEDSRPVLVHCSDGWDRTTQVVALAELMLDPYYRSIKGFQQLIEREWISFGHRFADRSGCVPDADPNQQSPIFLQWLDCVHQLLVQFPTSFQFNIAFLVKLAQHCFSLLYGTFLCNCERDREEERVEKQTVSVWHLLRHENTDIVNVLYREEDSSDQAVLFPTCEVHSIRLWKELFTSPSLIPYSTSKHTPTSSPPNTYSSWSHKNGHSTAPSKPDLISLSPHSNGSIVTHVAKQSSSPTPINSSIVTEQAVSDDPGIVEGLPSSMEDSFRVVVEAELSLTTCTIPQNEPTAANSVHSMQHRLVSSFTSECDSRLRHLGEDGLAKCSDPAQQRVREMKESLDLKIARLQTQLEQQTLALKRRLSDVEEVESPLVTSPGALNEDSELQFSCSPASGWTYVSALDSKGVQWVPDHSVRHCQSCGVEFWLGRRRHHCRSCGNVFCWQCSDYFCPVPHEQLFDNQRVCRKCYDKLDGFLKAVETSS